MLTFTVAKMAEITLPQPSKTQDDIPDESGANSQEAAYEERVHVEMGQLTEETNTQEPYFYTEEEVQEIDETKEGAESLDMEEKQTEEHSESTNEVEQPDKREEVITEMEETQEKVMDDDNPIAEVQDSLVKEPEMHAEMLDTEVPEMEGEGSASKTENGTETGAGDTERQRDTDDTDQNIERRSDGQTDRDEREDLADEAGDDRSAGEMVQETDGKVDVGGSVGKVEEGEKSSEDKVEEEATEKLEVEDRIESLGTEEAMKPGEEETQDSEEKNKVGHDLNEEDRENEDSTEKGKGSVNDEHNDGEAEELSSEAGTRQNDSEGGQDVRTQGNEIEDDGLNGEKNETEDGEQVRNKLTVEAEEEGQEKPNSEENIGGETKKVKDETMEDGVQKEEEEAKVEDKKIDEMAEGTDKNCVENELETGEKSEKEVTDMNKISENTLDTGNGKEEEVSEENTAQELEFNFEVQNEESVSQEEQNEIGSKGAPNDDIEASTKEEVDEPTDVNNDLLDGNIDTEKGERQDVSLEEVEKVEEYLQEELQEKSESETTGDRIQDVLDDNEMPETDKNMKEIEKDVDQEQETENKSDTELVPSERESQLGNEHEDQTSDNQKADKQDDKEKDDKESETSATTLIENVTSQITQEMVNKDTQNDIVSADATAQEPSESELKGTDTELRSRDAPEVMDADPVEPQEKKGNSVNNDGGSSVSHSLESQPVEKVKKGVKGPVLSIDSEDLAIHSTALTKAVGVDLVSNWINIHQESRYFQTFIEPLDEEGLILEETEERLNGEVLNATDTPTSTNIEGLDETLKSRDETATPVRKILNENESVVESLKTETKVEAIEADAHSNYSKDSVHTSTKDDIVQEAGYTRGSLVTTWSRLSNDEHPNQKDTSGQETSMPDDVINLETSATSEDNQEQTPSESEPQDVSTDVDLNAKESERSNKQDMTDETKHLLQTEEASNKETLESSEYIEPQSPTLTVITDLTIINQSENRIQDDTASVDFHSGQSDGSKNVDGNRKTKVIDGLLTQTLTSRDTLSTFSLDDSRLFGPTGYPILTTAHTENSY
ncbi:glutamic acid-rich protein-like [Carassius carassius]|uniref:glutamic acid-rich protein-like n=1 Tax=Carassius carassius TaxID=217509 RepID=UPI0028685541|nr:glutamic acid-rich protein-like [Carassius carassius]